jgi:cytochrome c biogenesis protein CcdA
LSIIKNLSGFKPEKNLYNPEKKDKINFNMRLAGLIFILLLSFPIAAPCQSGEQVEVLLFSSLSCRPCQGIKQEFLPGIKNKYKEKINIRELEITRPDNYLKLLELQEKYKLDSKKLLTPTIFMEGKFLIGSSQIKQYLEIYIDTALSKRANRKPKPMLEPGPQARNSAKLISHFQFISPLAIISAGLIDGINPCAFTVIIFFISFLALQGYARPQVLAIGLSFILAVFLTYVLIGLGLFSFLFQLKAYWLIVRVIYIAGALLCFILGGLAFYDFIRFRRTGRTQDLVLQLPAGFKHKIQRLIGFYYRREEDKTRGIKVSPLPRLILSAFILGSCVSLFEAVCTGQVYLPTIVFMLKAIPLKIKAISYLIIYNLMFIFPLWLILLFALWGVTSAQFGRFARRYMGTIKILMAALFLTLGVFLIRQ